MDEGRKDDRQVTQSHRQCISESRNRPCPKLSTRSRLETNPRTNKPKCKREGERKGQQKTRTSTRHPEAPVSLSLFLTLQQVLVKPAKWRNVFGLGFFSLFNFLGSFLTGKVTMPKGLGLSPRFPGPPHARGRGVTAACPQPVPGDAVAAHHLHPHCTFPPCPVWTHQIHVAFLFPFFFFFRKKTFFFFLIRKIKKI